VICVKERHGVAPSAARLHRSKAVERIKFVYGACDGFTALVTGCSIIELAEAATDRQRGRA
jgi:hypothetical protein